MKRVVKIGGIAAALVLLSAAGYVAVKKPAAAPPTNVKVAMTPQRIARGKYIFTLSDCDGCHSRRDFTRFGGPVIEAGRGEGFVFPAEMGLPGRIAASNITTDPETGIGNWTDGEKIRAIREGISRDGRALFPMMPYERLRHMSDEDVYSLVAYLNTLAPVKHKVARSEVDFPVSVLMKDAPRPAGSVANPPRGDRREYGKYLANLAGCVECHTPEKKGKLQTEFLFAGGRRFSFPGATVVSANITPDAQSGIGRWSEQDFVDRLYDYREYSKGGSPKVGPENFTVMPWLLFSQLPEEDLRAIYTFLRTQKPIYHVVYPHPLQLISRR